MGYPHIWLLQFTDNINEADMMDENSDRLRKMRSLSAILNKTFSKFYSPSENLAVDEVIVLFKGRAIFWQYIPKKHKRFGYKIYKPFDETGCMYDMTGYYISYRDSWFILVNDILETMTQVGTVEPRSIVPATIVFPHVPFAIFGPELSSI